MPINPCQPTPFPQLLPAVRAVLQKFMKKQLRDSAFYISTDETAIYLLTELSRHGITISLTKPSDTGDQHIQKEIASGLRQIVLTRRETIRRLQIMLARAWPGVRFCCRSDYYLDDVVNVYFVERPHAPTKEQINELAASFIDAIPTDGNPESGFRRHLGTDGQPELVRYSVSRINIYLLNVDGRLVANEGDEAGRGPVAAGIRKYLLN